MVAKRHKITNVPQKKIYVPHFLKQRDINSYTSAVKYSSCISAFLHAYECTVYKYTHWSKEHY
jgi:hypothetical protein